MKNLLVAVSIVLSLSLSACGGSHAGTYKLDVDAMAATLKPMLEKNPMMKGDALDKAITAMKEGTKGSMELKADNTWALNMTMKMGPMDNSMKASGTYKIDGEKISMTGKKEGDEKEKTHTGTLKGGVLAVDMDGQTATFKKQ